MWKARAPMVLLEEGTSLCREIFIRLSCTLRGLPPCHQESGGLVWPVAARCRKGFAPLLAGRTCACDTESGMKQKGGRPHLVFIHNGGHGGEGSPQEQESGREEHCWPPSSNGGGGGSIWGPAVLLDYRPRPPGRLRGALRDLLTGARLFDLRARLRPWNSAATSFGASSS